MGSLVAAKEDAGYSRQAEHDQTDHDEDERAGFGNWKWTGMAVAAWVAAVFASEFMFGYQTRVSIMRAGGNGLVEAAVDLSCLAIFDADPFGSVEDCP